MRMKYALIMLVASLLLFSSLIGAAKASGTIISDTFLGMPSNSIAQGQQRIIVANAIASGDLIEIKVNNVVQAGPIKKTVSYNPDNLKPGKYTIIADDLTAAVTENGILVVSNVPTLSIHSNTVFDSGQVATFNLTSTGGRGPFNVTLWNVTGKTYKNSTFFNTTPNTVVVSFITYSTKLNNKITFKGVGHDDGIYPIYTFNSSTDAITINPAMGNGFLNASNSPASNGINITLKESLSDGTSPFTYKFTVLNNGNTIKTHKVTVSSNTLTYTFSIASNSGISGYLNISATVTDSANVPETIHNSNTLFIIQQPAIQQIPATKSTTTILVSQNSIQQAPSPITIAGYSLSFIVEYAVIGLAIIGLALLLLGSIYNARKSHKK